MPPPLLLLGDLSQGVSNLRQVGNNAGPLLLCIRRHHLLQLRALNHDVYERVRVLHEVGHFMRVRPVLDDAMLPDQLRTVSEKPVPVRRIAGEQTGRLRQSLRFSSSAIGEVNFIGRRPRRAASIQRIQENVSALFAEVTRDKL